MLQSTFRKKRIAVVWSLSVLSIWSLCDWYGISQSIHITQQIVIEFFQCHEPSLKCQRLIMPECFHQEDKHHMKSHLKLPRKKSHNVTMVTNACETCLLETVKLIVVEGSKANMRRISLYSGTIQWRISDMLENVEDQAIIEMQTSPTPMCFVVETTDVTSFMCSVACFCRDILIQETLKEEFLFCMELQTTTSADVWEKYNSFDSAKLQWKYECCSLVKCARFHDKNYQLHQIWKS